MMLVVITTIFLWYTSTAGDTWSTSLGSSAISVPVALLLLDARSCGGHQLIFRCHIFWELGECILLPAHPDFSTSFPLAVRSASKKAFIVTRFADSLFMLIGILVTVCVADLADGPLGGSQYSQFHDAQLAAHSSAGLDLGNFHAAAQ